MGLVLFCFFVAIVVIFYFLLLCKSNVEYMEAQEFVPIFRKFQMKYKVLRLAYFSQAFCPSTASAQREIGCFFEWISSSWTFHLFRKKCPYFKVGINRKAQIWTLSLTPPPSSPPPKKIIIIKKKNKRNSWGRGRGEEACWQDETLCDNFQLVEYFYGSTWNSWI